MASFELGNVPLQMTLNLNEGADFISTIRTKSGDDWPTGAVVTLVFDDPEATEWEATITGDVIAWDVDKVAVQEIYDSSAWRVQLRYVSGTDDELWASGRVNRND